MRQTLLAARLAPGQYRRWIGLKNQKATEEEINPYGCADAANVLYTLGELPMTPAERDAHVSTLAGMQQSSTGLFSEPTHHTFHVTAHCIAALELFDARPIHPLQGLHFLLSPGRLESFLNHLPWIEAPWEASHQGAGVFAAIAVTAEADYSWRDRYFRWLSTECDRETGFWRRGCVSAPSPACRPIFHHLAGSFHYLFNHEWEHRPHPYPDAMVDSCLKIWVEKLYPVGQTISFAEIDWVYCLSRAWRQCGHRTEEVFSAMKEMAALYIGYLEDKLRWESIPFGDLHAMFGVICALAELQAFLPGRIRSNRPLKLVLDRRPFI